MYRYVKSSILLLPFLLTGCVEPIKMDAKQLSALPEERLCYVASPEPFKFDHDTIRQAQHQVMVKGHDCHPHHIACANYGLKKGTKEYLECRKHQDEMQMGRDTLGIFQQIERAKIQQQAQPVVIDHRVWP